MIYAFSLRRNTWILRHRLNSDLFVERDVGYAAWLLRPQTLGAAAQNDISLKLLDLGRTTLDEIGFQQIRRRHGRG